MHAADGPDLPVTAPARESFRREHGDVHAHEPVGLVAGEPGLRETVVGFERLAGGEGFLQAGDRHRLRPHARVGGAGGGFYTAQGLAEDDLAFALGVAAVDDLAAGVGGGFLAENREQAVGIGARLLDEIPELGRHNGQIVDVPRAELRVVGLGLGQFEEMPARGDDGELGAVGHAAPVRPLPGKMPARERRREVAPCGGLFGDEEDFGHSGKIEGGGDNGQSLGSVDLGGWPPRFCAGAFGGDGALNGVGGTSGWGI